MNIEELSLLEKYQLLQKIAKSIKDESKIRAKSIELEIKNNTILKDTILAEAVECRKFIEDIVIIDIPARLLSRSSKSLRLYDFPNRPITGAVVKIDNNDKAIVSYGVNTLWVCDVEEYCKKDKAVTPISIATPEVMNLEVIRWI